MISVITPAHNEAQFITKCIDSVSKAARQIEQTVEHIVVLNRCTDDTQQIAETHGAKTVVENARNLSRIRNTGVDSAAGDIIVTIDADSWMTENMFCEVGRLLESGRYIGGGVRLVPERMSLGILCSLMVVAPLVYYRGFISAGMFWCYKKDFDAIGGFNEEQASVEDVDFALRLKKYGKGQQKKYGTIRKAKMYTSCRKFDMFGDWFLVRRPWTAYKIFRGDQKTVDQFYYDVRASDQNK